jgi:hypothetical protein
MDALALELPILWGLAQLFEQTLILQSLCVDNNMLVVVLQKTRVQGYQTKPSSSVYVPRFNSVYVPQQSMFYSTNTVCGYIIIHQPEKFGHLGTMPSIHSPSFLP